MTADTSTEATVPIRFHYIKSPGFRVLHVDGAVGGITPRGMIHLATYSERGAIPRILEQSFSVDRGTPIEPEPRVIEARDGIVREMEADLVMTLNTAIEVRDWLNTHIAKLEELAKQKKGDTNA